MNASLAPFLLLLNGHANGERSRDLCRDLFSMENVWDDIDDGPRDETLLRMPSLHDRVIASRNRPAIPPDALWIDPPFGGDAA